jgi:hypothetical protein
MQVHGIRWSQAEEAMKRWVALTAFMFGIFSLAAAAQEQTGGAGTASASAPAQSPGTESAGSGPLNTHPDSAALLRSKEFTPALSDAILRKLADGLQSHSLSGTKSLFALDHFDPDFEGRMCSAFDQNESFRLYYHVNQASGEATHGEVTADFDIEYDPRQEGEAPTRKHAELRLQVELLPAAHGSKKWLITGISPSRFLF